MDTHYGHTQTHSSLGWTFGGQNEGKLQQCRKKRTCRKKMDKTNILRKTWIFANVARKRTLKSHTETLQPRVDIWGANMRVNYNNVTRKGHVARKWRG